MVTVTRSIEIAAAKAEAANAWRHFLDSVLIGRRRLACDEIACVSAVETGIVGFEAIGDDRTRLTLSIPLSIEESDEARELLEQKAAHDLVLFWSYIDSGDYAAEHGSRPASDDDRDGHSVKKNTGEGPSGFSFRSSFRA